MQLTGILLKRPFAHASNKWSKRFFVVQDGFLLYYSDSEKKEYDKKKLFNIHPKGVLPLGGCHIEPYSDMDHKFCVQISRDDVNGSLIIATESDYERDKWMTTLKESSRITWSNAQLGEQMIQQLEDQGMRMAQEKQNYFDQLQQETEALSDERARTEELERLNEELEREKRKMETYASQLKEQFQQTKKELDTTVTDLQSVELEKKCLKENAQQLQHNLEELEKEKTQTLETLQVHQTESQKLTKEKANLSEQTETLQQTLRNIEQQTNKVLREKQQAEEKLQENECRAQLLEEEKRHISEHANELKESIKEVQAQKALTEAELREELLARMEAEKRLRNAEASLRRLEKAVQGESEDGKDEEGLKEEMIGDVKTLKSINSMIQEEIIGDVKILKKFFENLAFEAKIDKDKPIMIKNSIHARKTMVRRAKTMRYEATKKKRNRDTSSIDIDLTQTVPNLSTFLTSESGSLSPTSPTFRHSSFDLANNNEEVF